MVLWRISNHTMLDGEGGRRAPGRWHSRGLPIVYLAESAAGAMLETLVHLKGRRDKLPRTYTLLRMSAPDTLSVPQLQLPADTNWKNDLAWSRGQGDLWLRERGSALLGVPSVVMAQSRNVLLNPLHSDAGRIRVEEVITQEYDERLFLEL